MNQQPPPQQQTKGVEVKQVDKCKSCGSRNLFDTCVDRNGYAVTDGSGRWTTICLDCDRDQNKRATRSSRRREGR